VYWSFGVTARTGIAAALMIRVKRFMNRQHVDVFKNPICLSIAADSDSHSSV
jgi:hypothetical protein